MTMKANGYRILIIGSSGSGKSTLAKQLSDKLGVEHVELDSFFFKEKWVERDFEDFKKRVIQQINKSQEWVIDGNYSSLREVYMPKVNYIICLDYSLPRILLQLIPRTLRRALFRERICNGNVESFRKSFLSKQSLILYTINTYERRRMQFKELEKMSHVPFIRISHPKYLKETLQMLFI